MIYFYCILNKIKCQRSDESKWAIIHLDYKGELCQQLVSKYVDILYRYVDNAPNMFPLFSSIFLNSPNGWAQPLEALFHISLENKRSLLKKPFSQARERSQLEKTQVESIMTQKLKTIHDNIPLSRQKNHNTTIVNLRLCVVSIPNYALLSIEKLRSVANYYGHLSCLAPNQ